jgi:hypothetical protein
MKIENCKLKPKVKKQSAIVKLKIERSKSKVTMQKLKAKKPKGKNQRLMNPR